MLQGLLYLRQKIFFELTSADVLLGSEQNVEMNEEAGKRGVFMSKVDSITIPLRL